MKRRTFLALPLIVALALLAAACSNSASASGGSGGATMHIASPANGATVPSTFTVKIASSVPLGDPSTGDDHVHLCFDGGSCDSEYTIVYGDSIAVSSLSPGTHTIEASLRNADHSAAGPTDTITVQVQGSGSTSAGSSGSSANTGGGSGGYNYGY